MEKGDRTYNPKQAWITAALVLGVSIFFGSVVLPYLTPAQSKIVGLPAPDFALAVLTGGEPGNRMKLSDQRGKAVILDFWASWCAPCRAQAPILERVSKKQDPSKVVVVGVNTGDEQPSAVRFANQHGIGYTTLFDEGGRVANAFRVRELPTLVVVNREGEITAVRTRVVQEEEIERLLETALADPG